MRFLFLFCMISVAAPAQEFPEREVDLAAFTDELLGIPDDDTDYSELYENLAQLITHPLDLNTASEDDMRMLRIFSETQIRELIKYRLHSGRLISVYELQAIPHFDLSTIYKLIPFVKVKDPAASLGNSLLRSVLKDGSTYIVARTISTIEKKKGFLSDDSLRKFRGQNASYYLRFRHSKPGLFSFGVTMDQDAGEKPGWKPASRIYGADHISYHAQIQNRGVIKNLIAGDFQAQFGQGLIYGGGFGLGKSAEIISSVQKISTGFQPFTSLIEAGYYRGAAATLGIARGISVSLLYSSALRDGTVNVTTNGSVISAFNSTGLHRNSDELAERNTFVEKSSGAVLSLRKNSVDAGFSFNRISFSAPVIKDESPYNQYAFQGRENLNIGSYFNLTTRNFSLFGEVARSIRNGTAAIGGVVASVHPSFDVCVLLRRYEKDFYTFYSNTLSESSAPSNENGALWGWKYQWKKKISLSGYVDLFKFPWLGFRRYVSSSWGSEFLVRLTFQPNRKTICFLQFREETKDRNVSLELPEYQVAEGTKRNYLLNFDCTVSPAIRLKSRAQYSTYSFANATTDGLVFAQDIRLDAGKITFTSRYAIFDTDNFDNRQYVFENDVWSAFSLPAYEGVGVRNFLIVEYKVSRQVTTWIRYSVTRYEDREEIGSGLELIEGNVKRDIKLQVRIKV